MMVTEEGGEERQDPLSYLEDEILGSLVIMVTEKLWQGDASNRASSDMGIR
jgi:hypothetical protein